MENIDSLKSRFQYIDDLFYAKWIYLHERAEFDSMMA